MKKYCFLFLVLALSLPSYAQIHQVESPHLKGSRNPVADQKTCLTEITPENILMEKNRDQQAFQKQIEKFLNHNSRATLEIQIKIHIVRKSNGSGGLDTSAVHNEFANYVNPYFNSMGWEFVECTEVDYIDIDEYYSLDSYSEGNAMSAAYNVPNVVNIYYVNHANGACGWTNFPWRLPKDYIVIANTCAGNKSTTVHEIGHYFGLYHTHETSFGDENVTRNPSSTCYNCITEGDLLCDTEADPKLNLAQISNPPGCVYSSAFFDNCGTFYDPNTAFIMSYAPKACRTLFTPMQEAKMKLIQTLGKGSGRNYIITGSCSAPANDLCINAETLSCGSTVTVSTHLATAVGSPNLFCGVQSNLSDRGIWYKIIGNGQKITATTCNNTTGFDTGLQILTGSCGNFTCIAGNDNDTSCISNSLKSTISFCSIVGETYYIFLFGSSGSTGTVQLSISCSTPPPVIYCLDNITTAINAGLSCGTVAFDLPVSESCPAGSMEQITGQPSGSCFPIGKTINTFMATDGIGNTATCSFTVLVHNNEPILYPNPSSGIFNIEFVKDNFKGNMEITIFDMLGRKVFSKLEEFDQYYSTEINLKNQFSGQYMIHLRIGEETFNHKLVLIK